MKRLDEKTRLLMALIQIDNLVKLTEDNSYKQFFYRHLWSMKYELERQLSLTKVKESTKMEE